LYYSSRQTFPARERALKQWVPGWAVEIWEGKWVNGADSAIFGFWALVQFEISVLYPKRPSRKGLGGVNLQNRSNLTTPAPSRKDKTRLGGSDTRLHTYAHISCSAVESKCAHTIAHWFSTSDFQTSIGLNSWSVLHVCLKISDQCLMLGLAHTTHSGKVVLLPFPLPMLCSMLTKNLNRPI